jgi:hypothetical protein
MKDHMRLRGTPKPAYRKISGQIKLDGVPRPSELDSIEF